MPPRSPKRWVLDDCDCDPSHPWAFDWTLAPEYSDARYGDLKERIAARLAPVALTR
jgi:hypothetical protein